MMVYILAVVVGIWLGVGAWLVGRALDS